MNLDDAAVDVPACTVCGGRTFASKDVLWDALIAAWELTPDEVRYVNRQQGLRCVACRSTLRCMTLAAAILRFHGYRGHLADFVASDDARALDVLEVNEAGGLTHFLAGCRIGGSWPFPAWICRRFPFPTPRSTSSCIPTRLNTCPIRLPPYGSAAACCGPAAAFTVPMIVGRLSRGCADRPPSYHGTAAEGSGGYRVHTEFGADAWRWVIRAGFAECRIVAIDAPAAHALVGIR